MEAVLIKVDVVEELLVAEESGAEVILESCWEEVSDEVSDGCSDEVSAG